MVFTGTLKTERPRRSRGLTCAGASFLRCMSAMTGSTPAWHGATVSRAGREECTALIVPHLEEYGTILESPGIERRAASVRRDGSADPSFSLEGRSASPTRCAAAARRRAEHTVCATQRDTTPAPPRRRLRLRRSPARFCGCLRSPMLPFYFRPRWSICSRRSRIASRRRPRPPGL